MNKLGEYFNNAEPLVYKGDSSWVLDTCTIGIEIEVEGLRSRNHQAPHQNDVMYDIGGMWALVSDGSLRRAVGMIDNATLTADEKTRIIDISDIYQVSYIEPKTIEINPRIIKLDAP
mgnify:CR=1 FL=1